MYKVSDFTLDEKIRFLNGVGAWRIYNAGGKVKEVYMSDGPNGLNKRDDNNIIQGAATATPGMVTVANTWSREMAALDGEVIAQDAIEREVDILLAPGINIKRTPLCGRNFEYISEDPYLTGVIGAEFVNGLQKEGIGTSVKHFCVNNREHQRLFQSSDIDERTLREIYLYAFEYIVKNAKPWTIMTSYNPVNGVYTAESKKLLHNILREDFGFDGLIMSDWGAVNSCYKSIKATLDLEMPYDERSFNDVKSALEAGLITEAEIDARVEKILELIEKTECKKTLKYGKEQRHENALEIAREGMVLLKNDGILPLKAKKVLLTGECGSAVLGGSGCAEVVTHYTQPTLERALSERKCDSEFYTDNSWAMRYIIQGAYASDAVVVCAIANSEGENVDRTDLRLSFDMEERILALSAVNPNVIVAIYGGSAVDVSRWQDKVKGIIFCGFGGEASNEALADILTGKVNPSGKLTETFPISINDTPVGLCRGNGFTESYSEGLFVGYRYYDRYGVDVAYPFGYGLSYSSFEYSNIEVKKLGDTEFEVSYDIENTSDVDGKEVSQVYVRDPFSMVIRPEKELKGFSKDLVRAGEKKRVSVILDGSAFAYYSTAYDKWHIENGVFEIMVGASSSDIRLNAKVEINLPDEGQNTVMSRSHVYVHDYQMVDTIGN